MSQNNTPDEVAPPKIRGHGFDYEKGRGSLAMIKVPTSMLLCVWLAPTICRTTFVQTHSASIFRFGLTWVRKLIGASTTPTSPLPLGGPKEAMALLVFALILNALSTYIVTPGVSVAGKAKCVGYNNRDPRGGMNNVFGKGGRMVASHQNMMEHFPLFALTVGLTAACAPPSSTSDILLTNVLVHVLLKAFLYPILYIYDVDTGRGFCHGFAIATLVNSLWIVITRL
ncbi:hypothetical protein FRB93_002145 [Tulasnella sp. JGI-2019a]|nr:hypothetical protein FRB93_002145 [Tulasnella sp. JGI-2019a]